MKPKQQLIYLPVKLEHNFVLSVLEEGRIIDKVIEKEAIIFTPEELNEYTQQVIKDTLESISERLYETFHTICEDGSTKGVFKTQKEALDLANKFNSETNLYHDWVQVTRLNGGMNKQSITNRFEQIYEKWKIK